ncbi:MAG: alpha/beta fold hydrolase [Pseudomonadota bacterium]
MADGQIAAGRAPTATVPGGLLRWLVALLAVVAIGTALWALEREGAGVDRVALEIGETPATLYTQRDAPPGPLVVVAHGFAGSRQFMEAFSLTLARSGYAALAFDFRGHGRNPRPMSGDVEAETGTTALLMDEIAAVIAAGQARPEVGDGLALVGHSMATDLLVREAARREDVDAIVAVSMFSRVVTPTEPQRLLMVTGQAEGHLREFAVGALQSVDSSASEGDTAQSGDVIRRAVVAPGVEHVGVLYSRTTLTEMRDWLDATFDRESAGPVVQRGPWVALLLAGIMALAWPLSALLPRSGTPVTVPSWRVVALASFGPALATPLLLWPLDVSVLPVLVADYLALHLGLYGLLQLAVLWLLGVRPSRGPLWPALALAAWGIGVFGLALDSYGASFFPHAGRWPIVGAVMLGAVPFMVADALATAGGQAPWPRRLTVRVAMLGSLGIAIALDFQALFFLIMILPIVLLFFLIFGTMGAWVGRRTGPLAPGLALGLIFGWAIGVSFPLFAG